MRSVRSVLAAVSAVLMFGLAAHADDPAQQADVRCVIVMGNLLGLVAEPQKSQMILGIMYFIGKLDGRTPALDLKAAVLDQAAKMTSDDMRTEAVRCGGELSARGQAIQAIGEELSKQSPQSGGTNPVKP